MLESNDIELLPDTQAGLESRNLAVNGAGISGLKLPLEIVDVDGQTRQTVAVAEAAVRVAADERGTHMSRLVEAVDHLGPRLELGFLRMHHVAMLLRLASSYGELTLRFPWFVSKQAPASGLKSWLDVEALYRVEGKDRGKPVMTQVLRVPVTTLCPCSKSISRYGAHNQRSYVTVALRTSSPVAIGPLVARIEAQASCAIYALLKRVDEKLVTERAYDNPKFAEDLVRDIHAELTTSYSPMQLSVATENQESIHNHAAFAFVGDDPRRWLSCSL